MAHRVERLWLSQGDIVLLHVPKGDDAEKVRLLAEAVEAQGGGDVVVLEVGEGCDVEVGGDGEIRVRGWVNNG